MLDFTIQLASNGLLTVKDENLSYWLNVITCSVIVLTRGNVETIPLTMILVTAEQHNTSVVRLICVIFAVSQMLWKQCGALVPAPVWRKNVFCDLCKTNITICNSAAFPNYNNELCCCLRGLQRNTSISPSCLSK